MTEKPKNNQNPSRKIKVYGCGLLLLMGVVFAGVLLTLGKDFLAGRLLLGSEWANCSPESRYQFTFSGEVFTVNPNFQPIPGAKVELFSEELKRILEGKAEKSSCESDYLQPIEVTSDPRGGFTFRNVRFAPWDDLSITVHADGYLPYEAAVYQGSVTETQNLHLSVFLEPAQTSSP